MKPCTKQIYRSKTQHNKMIQAVASTCANLWLLEEIALAQPRVIVTLSDREVYQRLRQAFALPTPSKFAEAVGQTHQVKLGSVKAVLFPMVHPDISRPLGEGDSRKMAARKKWAIIHQEQHIVALKEAL